MNSAQPMYNYGTITVQIARIIVIYPLQIKQNVYGFLLRREGSHKVEVIGIVSEGSIQPHRWRDLHDQEYRVG